MSWVSQGFRKASKALKPLRGVGRIVGGVTDVVSDFLPPGLRDVGNFTSKILQNQNIGKALKGTATDYIGGKVAGAIGGKLGGKLKTPNILPGKGIPNPDVSGALGVAGQVADKYATGSPFADKLTGAIGSKFGLPTAISGGVTSMMNGNGNGAASLIPGTSTGPASPSGNWLQKLFKTPGVVEGAFGLGGSLLQGYGQGKIAEADRNWDKTKFGVEMAPGIQRQIEAAPLRDRAMYMLMQRMGLPMTAFSPNDMFNAGGKGTMGGFDMGQLNAANQSYTPGAGGTNTLVQQQLLKKLGYGQPQGGKVA